MTILLFLLCFQTSTISLLSRLYPTWLLARRGKTQTAQVTHTHTHKSDHLLLLSINCDISFLWLAKIFHFTLAQKQKINKRTSLTRPQWGAVWRAAAELLLLRAAAEPAATWASTQRRQTDGQTRSALPAALRQPASGEDSISVCKCVCVISKLTGSKKGIQWNLTSSLCSFLMLVNADGGTECVTVYMR